LQRFSLCSPFKRVVLLRMAQELGGLPSSPLRGEGQWAGHSALGVDNSAGHNPLGLGDVTGHRVLAMNASIGHSAGGPGKSAGHHPLGLNDPAGHKVLAMNNPALLPLLDDFQLLHGSAAAVREAASNLRRLGVPAF
jgi:hypothetical protein